MFYVTISGLCSTAQTATSSAKLLPSFLFKIFKNIYFIYYHLILAALVLRCCVRAFSSCGERGLLFVRVRGLLIAVASLVVEQRL